jgi:hypothetical protein
MGFLHLYQNNSIFSTLTSNVQGVHVFSVIFNLALGKQCDRLPKARQYDAAAYFIKTGTHNNHNMCTWTSFYYR